MYVCTYVYTQTYNCQYWPCSPRMCSLSWASFRFRTATLLTVSTTSPICTRIQTRVSVCMYMCVFWVQVHGLWVHDLNICSEHALTCLCMYVCAHIALNFSDLCAVSRLQYVCICISASISVHSCTYMYPQAQSVLFDTKRRLDARFHEAFHAKWMRLSFFVVCSKCNIRMWHTRRDMSQRSSKIESLSL
jgi:hypothetical protein